MSTPAISHPADTPEAAHLTDREHAKGQIRSWALAIGIALVTRAAIAESRWIPSASMEPTLAIGDRLVVDKVAPRLGIPARGSILVFRPTWDRSGGGWLRRLGLADDGALIKRVVGLPGESVSVQGGRVFINGRPLPEGYASVSGTDMAPLTVPAGHLFMMGDNRDHSADSRVWGPLPLDHLVGRARFRFWPPGRVGTL